MRRFSVVAAGAVTVTAMMSAAVAGQAAAQITPQNPSGPVKGATQSLSSPEGLRAKIALKDLKAKLFPPLAGDNKSRLAYVDGKAEGTIQAGSSDAASVEVGYVVACGVKDGGFESWIGSNQTIGAAGALAGSIPAAGAALVGVGGSLGLTQNQVIKTAPGAIVYLPVGTKEIDKPKAGETFGVRFGEKRVSIEGCIGSVDAVAYATLKVSSRTFDDSKTVYSEVMRFA
ncbi:MspA family porin [Tsukamurella sp. M9C]|uniref:MspA family porin n=1 Tax=unclassified Tsukamurella TaxID=2633480 RepID=UPI001CC9C7E7|nr:MspA family porin [Tsukamurella sp. M9C]MCA0155246.1 MspA family porin [Tsukamurella sp. M9C]